MKFVMDERIKHRLTGLVVILSIAAIFLPAVMKKSNQRFEENVSFSVRLPAKPLAPAVAITDEKTVFQSVKVARVDVPASVEAKPAQIARAEPISIKSAVPAAPVIAVEKKPSLASARIESVIAPAVHAAIAPKKLANTVVGAVKKEVYAVQLASFTKRNNAMSLVALLRSKGYAATYNKANGKQGLYYKVIVGQLNQRHEALSLQKKLSDSMRLNGFIIKTGVS
jgi:DedD protein